MPAARQSGKGFDYSVEFFKEPNIDFLGKKWYFLAFSLVFSVAGVFSMLFWHGVPLGVDFRGGTLVYVKFSHPPDDEAIHTALRKVGLTQAKIQRLGVPANNEVLTCWPRPVASRAINALRTPVEIR